MEKKILSVLVFAMFLAMAGGVSAATVNVPGDHATIQEAIDASSEGDTIVIGPGDYYENLVIDKSITLQGSGRDNTVIHGVGLTPDSGYVITLEDSGLSLIDISVKDGQTVSIGETDGKTLLVENSLIDSTGYRYMFSHHSPFTNGEFIVRGSTLKSGKELIRGIDATGTRLIMENNEIYMEENFLWFDNLEDAYFANNYMTSTYAPAYLDFEFCKNVLVENNVFEDIGTYVIGNENIVFRKNSYSMTYVHEDSIFSRPWALNHYIVIEDNVFNGVLDPGARFAIQIDAFGGIIRGNTIDGYKDTGIWIGKAKNIVITENTVKDCEHGIYLNPKSQDVSVFNNNIIDSTVQAYDAGTNNAWDNGASGNYWSDFDTEAEGCFDADKDGICDAPYSISGSAGSQDNYPLTTQFVTGDANKGHGNDADGVDEENPGKGCENKSENGNMKRC